MSRIENVLCIENRHVVMSQMVLYIILYKDAKRNGV